MLKYSVIIDNKTKKCAVGLGSDTDTYTKLGYTLQDVEQSDMDRNWYLVGYAPMKTAEQKAQERQKEFNKEFFLTSLGYIRRKVSMSTGETRDFLFDLLPAIEKSVSIGQPYPVIVYKQPDFTKEITTEYLVSLQEFKNATEQFCNECTLQIGTDFSGVPMTLNG